MGSRSSANFQEGPELPPLEGSRIFLAWLCSQGCRAMARQPGWQGKESVKPTTKMSVLEITGPLLGRQKPPSGC